MRKFALVNGKIYVERGRFAQALYAEDGVIRLVGRNDEIRSAAGRGAEVFDCEGRTMIPGLNDSHMHLLGVGMEMSQLRLNGARSVGEIVARGQRFLAGHPELCRHGIAGIGWNQDLFDEGEKRLPDRHDLDRISTDVPVIVERVCRHIAAVNTKAIEMLGLGRNSPQYENGEFELEADGFPSGVFKEQAVARANRLIPPKSAAEYEDMFVKAADYAVAHGLTSVQSNDAGFVPVPVGALMEIVDRAHAGGRTALRYRHQMTFRGVGEFQEFLRGGAREKYHAPAAHVEIGPLKLFKDGSLGGRSAKMSRDYRDDPGNRGVETLSNEEMDLFCRAARDAGVQIITHAIGDRAIADTVACYERIMPIGENPLRHIVNHCQITDRPLLERIAADGLCVAYQPIFLDYDMHIAESRCGAELASTSYAFGTAAALGIPVGYGTDAPVEDCNPFPCIGAAVTRTDRLGRPEGGWFPREKVDVETAIDAYTTGSAYLEFHERDKGRLKPGFVADLAVLDRDIFDCPIAQIREILPVATVIGGEIVYRR